MRRYVIMVGILALVPFIDAFGKVQGQSPHSLSERLSDVRNVGLAVTETLGGYNLIVYNMQQDATNREILKKHIEEWGDTAARFRKYQDLTDKAVEKGDYDSAQRYKNERDRNPPRLFDGVEVCRVVRVGSDYIELEQLYRAEGTIVVPFNRLVRIQFVRE